MTRHRRLLPSTIALLLLSAAAQSQPEPTSPDWNAQAQTSSPALQRQVPSRMAAPRGTAPVVTYQGNAEQTQAIAPNGDARTEQPYEAMRQPSFNTVQNDGANTIGLPLDQQVKVLRDQVRQLLQRQAATEQMLATHVHTITAAGTGSIKYKTIKYFLENNPEAELQLPGAGTRYLKETSGPVVTRNGPISP